MKHWKLLIPIIGILYGLSTNALEDTWLNNRALYFTSCVWQVCFILITAILILA